MRTCYRLSRLQSSQRALQRRCSLEWINFIVRHCCTAYSIKLTNIASVLWRNNFCWQEHTAVKSATNIDQRAIRILATLKWWSCHSASNVSFLPTNACNPQTEKKLFVSKRQIQSIHSTYSIQIMFEKTQPRMIRFKSEPLVFIRTTNVWIFFQRSRKRRTIPIAYQGSADKDK